MKTGIILATGPSLNRHDLVFVREAHLAGKVQVFGMNHVWLDYPPLDVFLSCNIEYYESQWDKGLKDIPAEKWTWHQHTAEKYGIKHVKGRWQDGFSRDPEYIHLGHSSGFQLPGLAYCQYGCRRLLLLGYDMKYSRDYDGRNHNPGSTPRHYFGEYEDQSLQHWPSVKVIDGVHVELIQQFERVKEINTDLEIINCTPGSAMTCFPIMGIKEALALIN